MAARGSGIDESWFVGYSNARQDSYLAMLEEVNNDEWQTQAVCHPSLYEEYRGRGYGSQLMVKMLELLKRQGYKKASLAVQKANYAVKMYENVGFQTIDENAEEYIMMCEL